MTRDDRGDRRRVEDVEDRASGDVPSDDVPTPIVDEATARQIRADSPWFDGEDDKWRGPRSPDPEAPTEEWRRFEERRASYHNDLERIYGEAFVTNLAIDALREANKRVDLSEVTADDLPDPADVVREQADLDTSNYPHESEDGDP